MSDSSTRGQARPKPESNNSSPWPYPDQNVFHRSITGALIWSAEVNSACMQQEKQSPGGLVIKGPSHALHKTPHPDSARSGLTVFDGQWYTNMASHVHIFIIDWMVIAFVARSKV